MKKVRNFTLTVVGSIVIYEALRRTGTLDKIKGEVKLRTGKFLEDPKLQLEGIFDIGKGAIKKTVHESEDWLDNLIK